MSILLLSHRQQWLQEHASMLRCAVCTLLDVSNIYVFQEKRNYSDQVCLQWSVTPQSVVLWPQSYCAHSDMRSCSLGKGYADGRVQFTCKVTGWLAECKDDIYRRKVYFCVTVVKLQYKANWTVATVLWRYRAVSVTVFCRTETQFQYTIWRFSDRAS